MRRPSVLIVDDDAFSRAVVSRRVAKLSDVVEAEDGVDALAHLKTAEFDLAIVDLEMPNCNGLELIKSVRAHPTLKHIPIIVLTGNESRAAIESALSAGATSFLLKPLDWSAFGEHIRHVLHLAHRAGHMAVHDNLTGLPNRVLLNERLEQALARAKRDEIVVAHILDLDHFKHVNDTLGHPVGDKLLQMVATRLRKLVRETDTVARMGGDEFAIVQAPLVRASDAETLARRVIEAVSQPYEIDGHQVVIGVSVGIAVGPLGRGNPGAADAQCRPGAVRGQGRRARHLPVFRAGDGRADAGAPHAGERPAQGNGRRRVRALLPARRQPREQRHLGLRGLDPLEPSRSRASSSPTPSSRSPRRSA